MGEDDREPHIRRAGDGCGRSRTPDGGWGESCASYDNDIFTPGGEYAVADRVGADGADGRRRYLQFERADGIEYLIERRQRMGRGRKNWPPTGFPKVFYLNYHYYRLYFPLMAAGLVRLEAADWQ